jgi:hypothetical protein
LFDHINEEQLEDPEIGELIHRDEENEINAFELRERGKVESKIYYTF